MLKRSVFLLSLAGLAGVALAQGPAQPPPPPAWHGPMTHGSAQWHEKMQQRRMERLTVLLDLTPVEQRKVQAIMAEEHASMKPHVEQMMRDMRAMRDARRAAHQDAMRKLAAVLTPAQMKKLELLMPPHRWGMMHPGGMMGPGMMGPGMGKGPPGPP